MSRIAAQAWPILLALVLVGCGHAPLASVSSVDLDRYAGDWYVLAHLPTRAERNAYDAVEHYDLREDGRIRVRFTFREGGHDGEREVMRFRAWVHDETTRAEWRVRPFWPIALAYVVMYLDDDYQVTVVGHPSRDYAWVMARRTELPEETWAEVRAVLTEAGFDLRRLRRVPHRGAGPATPPADDSVAGEAVIR